MIILLAPLKGSNEVQYTLFNRKHEWENGAIFVTNRFFIAAATK